MDDEDIAHLAGLFDAAGSVTVHITKDTKYKIGYRYEPLIRVFRPADDEATLGKLDAFAEENTIQHNIIEDGSTIIMEMYRPQDIERFLAPLYPWLVTKHEAATIMLEDVLPGLEAERHKTKEGFYELVEYADTLRAKSRSGSDPKYTQEFFEDEWDIEATA